TSSQKEYRFRRLSLREDVVVRTAFHNRFAAGDSSQVGFPARSRGFLIRCNGHAPLFERQGLPAIHNGRVSHVKKLSPDGPFTAFRRHHSRIFRSSPKSTLLRSDRSPMSICRGRGNRLMSVGTATICSSLA